MLTYAVVAGRDGRPVPPEVLAALRDRRLETSFEAERHDWWASPSGSIAAGGWSSTADDRVTGDRWRADGERVTAFSGLPFRREDPWESGRPWADQLAASFARRSIEHGTDALLGVFTVLSLDAAGHGAVASDPLGIGLLYMAQTDEVTVVAPRAGLVADVLTAATGAAPARDPLDACWLAYAGFPLSTSTGYADVEVVPHRSIVRLDPDRGAQVVALGREQWLERPESEAERRRLVDGLRADIATTVRTVAGLPIEHLAGLTGGRDSRLVLAVMLEEGLAGDFEFRTSGAADLPDVLIARELAQRFGLQLTVNAPDPVAARWRTERVEALRAAGHVDLPYREAAMRTTVGAWQGMRNVAEPKPARPPDGGSILISGICGEMLRSNYPGAKHYATASDAARFPWGGMKCGQAGILRREALEHYDRTIVGELLDGVHEGEQPRDVVDAFYVRQRMRRWFGGGLELDAPNRVFPLYSDVGLRAAFAIGPQARHAEWLHYELIRAACAPLLEVPLDQGAWDPSLREHAPGTVPERPPPPGETRPARPPVPLVPPGARPADGPPPTAGPPRVRTVQRERRAELAAIDTEIMRRHLLDDPANPVFEVLDRARVATAIGRFDELPDTAKIQLYGALTAAMWLGRAELPAVLPLQSTGTG